MKRFSRNILTLMVWVLLPVYCALGQQATIEGSVTDASGTPLNEATVTLTENPNHKVTTNEKGQFAIEAQVGQHLQITSADGQSKTISIEQSNLNITLQGGNKQVPVGYGLTRSQNELTSAVDVVGSENLSKRMVNNPENALYGQLPGLMMLENGGLPLSSPDMYIRGQGTFTDSNPLVLIDGFEQPLSAISTYEIESVSVLKDAAALTKYGQRGANGVVLVTTKRGNNSGLHVNASYEQAFTQPTQQPDFLDAPRYARAINEARANDGLDPRYSSADLQAYESGSSPYLYPNVDWFNEVLRNSGTNSNYNVSFRGGGDRVRYFTLMNVVFENGIFGPVSRNEDYSTQAKYSRFNFRTNLDIDMSDNLLLKLDVGGNIEENNLPGGGAGPNQIFDALYSIPSAAFPVRTPDGNWGGTQNYDNNPVAMLTSTGFGQPNRREFSLTGTLQQDLSKWTEGLSAEATVRYNNYNNFAESKTKDYRYQSLSPVRDQNGNIVDTTTTNYGQNTDLNFNSFFSNEREFSDIVGKVNYESTIGANNVLEGMLLFHQSSRIYDGQDNTFNRRNMVANVHMGFDEKYFVDVSASYSGNNLLPEDNRYILLPAISGGWLVSNEEFLQDVTFLDRLKLQASWGVSGSDRIPSNNPHIQAYNNSTGYWFQNGNNYQGGFAEGRLPTSDFTAETSYKTNVGLEAMMFGKLELATDLFFERRTNILTGTGGQLSEVVGIDAPQETNGIVENKGIEAALNWQDNIGDFGYQIGGQVTMARNEIIEMNESYVPNDYLRRTGRSVGQIFGMEAIGFFEDEADIANSPRQVFSEVAPGDIKYKDQNGDGIINEFDEIPLGYNSTHPEVYFSTSLGANYKGLSISALFQGTANYTAYLNTQSVFWPIQNNNTISEHYYSNRWTPQSGNNALYPRLTTGSSDNNFRPNSTWMTDRSYFKLRTLEVSYTLPSSITQMWKMNKVTILGRGMNLFSIDNIPVLDPEHISAGYPILRSYNVGLEIAF